MTSCSIGIEWRVITNVLADDGQNVSKRCQRVCENKARKPTNCNIMTKSCTCVLNVTRPLKMHLIEILATIASNGL